MVKDKLITTMRAEYVDWNQIGKVQEIHYFRGEVSGTIYNAKYDKKLWFDMNLLQYSDVMCKHGSEVMYDIAADSDVDNTLFALNLRKVQAGWLSLLGHSKADNTE